MPPYAPFFQIADQRLGLSCRLLQFLEVSLHLWDQVSITQYAMRLFTSLILLRGGRPAFIACRTFLDFTNGSNSGVVASTIATSDIVQYPASVFKVTHPSLFIKVCRQAELSLRLLNSATVLSSRLFYCLDPPTLLATHSAFAHHNNASTIISGRVHCAVVA